MNVAIVVGNLGADPDLKNGEDEDRAVARISVATDSRIKGEDVTQWHRITIFGKQAINAAKYLKKGSKVGVTAEIRYGKYDKDGQTVYTTDLIANRVEYLSSKAESEEEF
jgi:single-strand DNA-binding protein